MRRGIPLLAFLSAASLGAVVGCEVQGVFVAPETSDERMLVQARFNAYDEDTFFTDSRVMRTPPAGTIDRHAYADHREISHGIGDSGYVAEVPVSLSRELLLQGRARYQVFCAACHGLTGDGASAVAERMTLVRPRTLVTGEVAASRAGAIFRTITEGYGLMPSYASQLSVMDRWSVVAYVRVLQHTKRRLADLTPEARTRAERALP
jgi:mono/diheme cytochrome c family protein